VVSQLIAVRPLGAGCGMRDRWSTGRLEAFSDGVFADNRPSLTTRTGFLPIQGIHREAVRWPGETAC
jgi:hypothetical protein